MVNLYPQSILARSSYRFFLKHPAQLLLSIIGITLGIAIVTAVIITNASSRKAFELSASAITGQSTHQITGSGTGIDQSHYVNLRKSQPYEMAPIIEGYLTIEGNLYTLLGIDPLAAPALNRNTGSLSAETALRLVTEPGSVLMSQKTAERTGLPVNQPMSATFSGGSTRVTVIGLYSSENPAATDGLLITDIATAQELLQRGNRIDRIDLVLRSEDALQLETSLPATLQLGSSGTRNDTMKEMTRGFHINLTAMSLLSLLVGAFLIHNTMTFSILQRRELFATLRITGVTSSGIFYNIITEALIISLIGSLLGVAVGYLIATQLIHLTTRTINDLYFVLHVQELWFNPVHGAAIVALGLLISLLAASAAALEAARKSPLSARTRSGVESVTRNLLPFLAIAGLSVAIVGLLLARIPTESIVVGFGAMMLLIAGYGLIIPWLVSVATIKIHRLAMRSRAVLQLAAGGIHRSISRTGLAIAALTIAVSATLGVDIMIGSFRSSVEQWLEQTLQSDIYLSVEGQVSTRADGALDPPLIQSVRALPDVLDVGTTRGITLNSNVGSISTNVLDPNKRSASGYSFLTLAGKESSLVPGDSDQARIWSLFKNENHLLISEPLARKHNLRGGDSLTLLTDNHGDQAFTIAGVYRDYGSSHGRITIARKSYNKSWNDSTVSALGIILRENSEAEPTAEQIRRLARDFDQQILVRSNQDIRRQSLTVFDQTFKVTSILRLLTIGVAFVGVFSALLALQLEKAKEFAVIRATGATQTQVATIVILQTVLMGILAGLMALPLGWIMSDLLINVINLRSFGWTMKAILPAGSVFSTMALALTAATLAGLYPAWKLSRADIATRLRDE